MAEEGGAQWQCKETNQPTKQAWMTSMFHRTPNQHQRSSTATIQEQIETFESELQIYCGDDPLDIWDRNFLVRVSSQESSAAEDTGMDRLSATGPLGTSLMDPDLGGKKMALPPKPISLVLDSISCYNRGLQPPPATHNVQTNPMAVFDEYPPGASCPEPFKHRSIPCMASSTPCTKENNLTTEQWTNSKRPRKFTFDNSAVVTSPKKKNFQPFIDETNGPPEVSRPQYRSMYLKEALLLTSDAELCFEELRALRYSKRTAQELEEKRMRLQRVKEELRLEIEEKQRLLQKCSQQLVIQHQEPLVVLSKCRSAHSAHPPDLSAVGLGVHCGSNSSSPPKLPFQGDDISSDDVFVSAIRTDCVDHGSCFPMSGENALRPQADGSDSHFTHFTIFDESSTRESFQAMTPVPAQSKLSRKPLAMLKPLGGTSLNGTGPNALERTEHQHDFSTASGNQNYTLFSSPEGTGDCAPQMGSTLYKLHTGAGSDLVLPKGTSGHTTNSKNVASKHATLTWKKLSPIQEASCEDLSSLSCLNASNPHNKLELAWCNTDSTDKLNPTAETPTDVEMVDPCSLSVKRRLLEEVDLTSCLGLHRKPGPLPSIHEYDVLSPGNEPFLILSKVITSENHAVYFGLSQSSMSIVQVDFQCVPWNFYISTQLKNRLTSEPHRGHSCQTSCFMYEDGCITISQGSYIETLREFLDRSPLQQDGAALLTIELVELVEEMHVCHLVHGDLRPDTLIMRHRDECESGSGVLKVLDFSCCLDLSLQPEITSCRGLPPSHAYLRQGVLSPSSTPYQVDLLGIAETVYLMLKGGDMQLVEENSKWKLAGDEKDWESSPGDTDAAVWQEFFRKVLNPGARSTVAVLSELRQDLRKHFAAGPEALTMLGL